MAKKYWFALLAYDSLGKSEVSDSCDRPNNLTQIGFNRQFVSPCDLEIWWMTFKNYRAPLVYYNKFCALFQSHRWIKTGVTVWKRPIVDFLSRVTLKCDGWPWKKIGHLFYAAWSFVHHFKAIGEFKLELKSGNAHFGSKSVIFCPMWPWNLTDDWKIIGHLFYAASSFLYHFIAIDKFKLELKSGNAQFRSKSAIFVPCDLEIWRMTLKNNRAPLLCCIKLSVSFHSH